jgi:hypothetical protein
MASAYSTPIQYKPYESNVDVQFITQALAYKQQKYDANYEKMSNFFQNMANVDFAKEEDRQRYFDRLNSLRDEVNRYGMGDLSQTGVSENIMSHIGQAADEKTLNGYYGTLAIRKIQKEAEKAKEKGTYNPLNYSYSMQEASEWINDGQAGSSYKGGSSYIPYTDVIQKMNDRLKEIKPDFQIVSYGQGIMIVDEKYEQVPEYKVRGVIQQLMSDPNIQQQMKINAWGSYGRAPEEQLKGFFKGSVENTLNQYNNYISSLEEGYKKAKTKSEKDSISKELDEISKRRNELNSNLNDFDNYFNTIGKERISETLYNDELTSSFIQQYAKNNLVSINRTTDKGKELALKHSYKIKEQKAEKSLDFMKEMVTATAKGDFSAASAYANASDLLKLQSGQPLTDDQVSAVGMFNLLKNTTAFIGTGTITDQLDGATAVSKVYADVESSKAELAAIGEVLGNKIFDNQGNLSLTTQKLNELISQEKDAYNRSKYQDLIPKVQLYEARVGLVSDFQDMYKQAIEADIETYGSHNMGDGKRIRKSQDGSLYLEDRETIGEVASGYLGSASKILNLLRSTVFEAPLSPVALVATVAESAYTGNLIKDTYIKNVKKWADASRQAREASADTFLSVPKWLGMGLTANRENITNDYLQELIGQNIISVQEGNASKRVLSFYDNIIAPQLEGFYYMERPQEIDLLNNPQYITDILNSVPPGQSLPFTDEKSLREYTQDTGGRFRVEFDVNRTPILQVPTSTKKGITYTPVELRADNLNRTNLGFVYQDYVNVASKDKHEDALRNINIVRAKQESAKEGQKVWIPNYTSSLTGIYPLSLQDGTVLQIKTVEEVTSSTNNNNIKVRVEVTPQGGGETIVSETQPAPTKEAAAEETRQLITSLIQNL